MYSKHPKALISKPDNTMAIQAHCTYFLLIIPSGRGPFSNIGFVSTDIHNVHKLCERDGNPIV